MPFVRASANYRDFSDSWSPSVLAAIPDRQKGGEIVLGTVSQWFSG